MAFVKAEGEACKKVYFNKIEHFMIGDYAYLDVFDDKFQGAEHFGPTGVFGQVKLEVGPESYRSGNFKDLQDRTGFDFTE